MKKSSIIGVAFGIIVILLLISNWGKIFKKSPDNNPKVSWKQVGFETLTIPFTIMPNESHPPLKIFRITEDGKDKEFLEYNISFDEGSENSYILFSAEGFSGKYGSDPILTAKFVPGENPFYTIPGTGTKNRNLYFLKLANQGVGPAKGTITLFGVRRVVYDSVTGQERPMVYK
jgi:hypothetical protein